MNLKTKICALLFMTTLVFSCDEIDKLTEFNVDECDWKAARVGRVGPEKGMPGGVRE